MRLKNLLIPITLLAVAFTLLQLFRNSIVFHTDIARDFLLMQDIVVTHKPVLIGARAGGIPGFFHGPLWLYTNLPAYILSNGNPTVIGVFWIGLYIILLVSVYSIASRLFNRQSANITTCLLALVLAPQIDKLGNPFGAVLFTPIFFYLYYRYLESKHPLFLASAYFVIGLLIQYQIAFGLPILLLATLLTIFWTFSRKVKKHLLVTLTIAIPLSTYVVFELRHDFLQMRSFLEYVFGDVTYGKQDLLTLIMSRIRGILVDGIQLYPERFNALSLLVTGWFAYLYYSKNKLDTNFRKIFYLYLYFYFGFWVCAFFFSGVIWGYYYSSLLPLTVLILGGSISQFGYKNLYIKAMIIFIIAIQTGYLLINMTSLVKSEMVSGSSWKSYKMSAEQIYDDSPSEFSYYIFTPDQFAYSMRYAMTYTSRNYQSKNAIQSEKKKITYVIRAPAPIDKPNLNGDWWLENQVRIKKKPILTTELANGYKLEKYVLSPQEVAIPSDPNIISNTLLFR